jgi:hypothetical protein
MLGLLGGVIPSIPLPSSYLVWGILYAESVLIVAKSVGVPVGDWGVLCKLRNMLHFDPIKSRGGIRTFQFVP